MSEKQIMGVGLEVALELPKLAPPVVRGRFRFTNYTAEYIMAEKQIDEKRLHSITEPAVITSVVPSTEEKKLVPILRIVRLILDGVALSSPVKVICFDQVNDYYTIFGSLNVNGLSYSRNLFPSSFFGNFGTSLDEEFYCRMDLSKYCISPKLDGLRSIVNISGNVGKATSRDGSCMSFLMADSSLDGSCLDCECLLYDGLPTFVIFDVYSIALEQRVFRREQWDRLRRLRYYKFASPSVQFDFQKFNSIAMLTNVMESKYPVDGIVFTKLDSEYLATEVDPDLKFWKPPDRISVDLELKKISDDEGYHVLAQGKEGLEEICDSEGYPIQMFAPCDGIFECIFNLTGLEVVRQRLDKKKPNSVQIYEKTLCIHDSDFNFDFLLNSWKDRNVKKTERPLRAPRVKSPPILNALPRARTFYTQRAFKLMNMRRKDNEEYMIKTGKYKVVGLFSNDTKLK